MKLNLTQGSKDWLLWRTFGLGGSDISKLMGAYFFCYNNVTTLWKDKIGLSQPFKMNDAVQHGMDNEEQAREFYTRITGNVVTAHCFQHDEFPYLKASMDGITDDLKIAVEIKVPQEKGWLAAKKGVVKDYYYSQMQHQMLVTGAEYCDYWVYNVDEGACHFKVYRSEEYMAEILKRAKKFWEEFVIPRRCPVSSDFGMDDRKKLDHFKTSDMKIESLGLRPNIDKLDFLC